MSPVAFAVLDLETTGLSPETDRIVEIAIVRTRGLDVAEEFSTLVRPSCSVGASERVHGLSDDALAGAPTLTELGEVLGPMLRDATCVAHRAAFDRAFLDAAVQRGELPPAVTSARWLDTAALAERAFGESGLRRLATRLGGPLPTHRALPDARAALSVLAAVCELVAPRHADDLVVLGGARAAMRDDHAELFTRARDAGEPIGVAYRPANNRVFVDTLAVESVTPPYVTGTLARRGVRRVLRGDRLLRVWLGAAPTLAFFDGTPAPTASPQ